MTAIKILKVVQRRGTIDLMNKYPRHKKLIAIAALSDTRYGHGKIK